MSDLLVASSGGHLKQLHRLAPRIAQLDGDRVWVTYRTSQSVSLLAGERVLAAHAVESRDYLTVARNAGLALRVLRRVRPRRVISTGSAVALSFLPAARALGIPCHYIESAARSEGPSQTGRALARVPGLRLYTQYPGWARPPWRYLGSVFDDFEPASEPRPPAPLRRVVLALGTSELYGFRRLVERLLAVLPDGVETLWQTGTTDVAGLPIAVRPWVPAGELDAAIAAADVVVTHAGTGTALAALEAGRAPVLVPRVRAHGENVDDHQALIAAELARRGLAVAVQADALTLEDLLRAGALAVRRRAVSGALQLAPD